MHLNKASIYKMALLLATSTLYLLTGCMNTSQSSKVSDDSASAEEFQKQEENNAEDASKNKKTSLLFVKDFPDLDPEKVPVLVNGFFIAQRKDGKAEILNANGENLPGELFERVVVFPDEKDFIATPLEGDSNSNIKQDYLYSPVGQSLSKYLSSGMGCASTVEYWYDPSSEKVMKSVNGKNELTIVENWDWDTSDYDPNYYIRLPVKENADAEAKSGEHYVLNLKTMKVYGPVSDQVFYSVFDHNDIFGYYDNCRQSIKLLLPVEENGSYHLVSGGQYGKETYEKAVPVGLEYTFAENAGNKYIVGPGVDDITLLPEQAELSSGLWNDSVFILEDGIWKLYQKPGARELNLSQQNTNQGSKVLKHNMKVRKSPGIHQPEIEVLPAGTVIDIYNTIPSIVYGDGRVGDEWAEIDYAGSGRWVCLFDEDNVYVEDLNESDA